MRPAAIAGLATAGLCASLILLEPDEAVARTGIVGTSGNEMTDTRGFAVAFRLLAEDGGESAPQANKDGDFDKICRTIERVSAENELPVDFFTRLIWQESGFATKLVSRKGARGIAQFMPATAMERGLRNPFEPLQALEESASYLRELFITFGNLGLAAAAYNAGPGRISRWLAGKAGLPGETSLYVQVVTGHAAEEWASANPPRWEGVTIPKDVPCEQLDTFIARSEAAKAAASKQTPELSPASGQEANASPAVTAEQATLPESPAQATPAASSPDSSPATPQSWGVQLAGSWEEGKVLASFERIRRQFPEIIGEHQPLVLRQQGAMGHAARYVLRISEPTRLSADALCEQLRAANGACLVLANPRPESAVEASTEMRSQD
jgi:hypothetical protein